MRWSRGLFVLFVGMSGGWVGGFAEAQQQIEMLEPLRVFPEEFTQIRGLRELSDGRLIITDWLEERLVVIDFETETSRDLYRVGPGPEEFRLPQRLIAMPGDTTLLQDRGNQRLLILDPELNIVGLQRGPPSLRYRPTPRAVDSEGRFYFTLPGWATGREPSSTDSIDVWRWDRATDQVVALAKIQGSKPRSDAGQPRMTPGIPFVMFAAQDGWSVAQDGTVSLVRAGAYRVDRVASSGEVEVGPALPSTSRPVTARDRHTYVRDFLETSPIGGRGVGLQPPDAVDDGEVAQMVRTNEFAETIPPFVASEVHMAANGRLWVGHWSLTGDAPPTYDVFHPAGRLLYRVQFPKGRHVIGFGKGVVYIVATDQLGLQRLEVYERPPL